MTIRLGTTAEVNTLSWDYDSVQEVTGVFYECQVCESRIGTKGPLDDERANVGSGTTISKYSQTF